MSRKPIVLCERAQRDIDEAVAHYLAEAAPTAAQTLIGAVDNACRQISAQPAAGSPRYAHELDLPGLRFRSIRRFPHLIFYIETETEIVVWRVLHGARDLPAWLGKMGGN